jgi:RHS repeat-associated protein
MPTDETGAVEEKLDFYPYGQEISFGTLGDESERKYTGHQRDGRTGLDYMMARYKAPWLGSFQSPDPIDDVSLAVPWSWNKYAYVRGNPVSFSDPTGMLTPEQCDKEGGRVENGQCCFGEGDAKVCGAIDTGAQYEEVHSTPYEDWYVPPTDASADNRDWRFDPPWADVDFLLSNRFVGGNKIRIRISNFTPTPAFLYTVTVTSSCWADVSEQERHGIGFFGNSKWETFTAPGSTNRDLVVWDVSVRPYGSPVFATLNPHPTPQNPQVRSTRMMPLMLGTRVQTNGRCFYAK